MARTKIIMNTPKPIHISRDLLDPTKPLAVIDIGSHSIRLIVFQNLSRIPKILVSKKVFCELGKDLQKTGQLNAEKLEEAFYTLKHYIQIAKSIPVQHIRLLATAAIRDAQNGMVFVTEMERKLNISIKILTGEEEARNSSLGVSAGILTTSGIMGDLGGGSLELMNLQVDSPDNITLPLGPLRLTNISEAASYEACKSFIEQQLKQVTWINNKIFGQTFYAVGGSWRVIAKLHMQITKYPLEIVHQYKVNSKEVMEFCENLIQNQEMIVAKYPVLEHRIKGLPFATMVLQGIIRNLKPAEIEFSASGLREGYFYSLLPQEEIQKDPLLFFAGTINDISRYQQGQAVYKWCKFFFNDLPKNFQRLLQAACYLSDWGWNDHQGYPEENRFNRILYMPTIGLTHIERIALAYIDRYRYVEHAQCSKKEKKLFNLLPKDLRKFCNQAGLIIDLSYKATAGIPEKLNKTELKKIGKEVILLLPEQLPLELKFKLQQSLNLVAKKLSLTAKIKEIN